jgi:hypothetical protein
MTSVLIEPRLALLCTAVSCLCGTERASCDTECGASVVSHPLSVPALAITDFVDVADASMLLLRVLLRRLSTNEGSALLSATGGVAIGAMGLVVAVVVAVVATAVAGGAIGEVLVHDDCD